MHVRHKFPFSEGAGCIHGCALHVCTFTSCNSLLDRAHQCEPSAKHHAYLQGQTARLLRLTLFPPIIYTTLDFHALSSNSRSYSRDPPPALAFPGGSIGGDRHHDANARNVIGVQYCMASGFYSEGGQVQE